MSDFIVSTVSQIGETITGKTPPSESPEDFGGSTPFVTPSDSFDQKFITHTQRSLSSAGVEKLESKLLPPCSVLVTCIGSAMGKVAMCNVASITNQQINSIIVDDEYSPDYIYYTLKNNYRALRNAATGSTALPLLNKGDFDALKFRIHSSKAEQQRIAAALSTLDAKIDLNNRINAELEALAKTIYDYWFVQFDFPGANGRPYRSSGGKMVWNEALTREIPAGWEAKQLGQLGALRNGINYDPSVGGDATAKIINVRNVSASTIFVKVDDLDSLDLDQSNIDKYLMTEDSILIARSGIPGATRMMSPCPPNTIYCGFIICLKVADRSTRNAIFFRLKQIESVLLSQSSGSILKNVSQDTLKGISVVLPGSTSRSILQGFDDAVEPLLRKVSMNNQENIELTRLRDWLLPLLMNGQVRVA